VECCCREAIIKQRLRNRSKSPAISDTRLKHLDEFKCRYEAPDEIPAGIKITVNTEGSLAETVKEFLPRADMAEPST
jgi:hypothetical protein